MRVVAHAVGLPVDSPALDDAHRHLRALYDAVEDSDRRRARRSAVELRAALARVPADERPEAAEDVAEALADAVSLLGDAPAAEIGGGPEPSPAAAGGQAPERSSPPPEADEGQEEGQGADPSGSLTEREEAADGRDAGAAREADAGPGVVAEPEQPPVHPAQEDGSPFPEPASNGIGQFPLILEEDPLRPSALGEDESASG